MSIENFNPNGVGLDNGNFMGLPFTEADAKIVVISVPWDVTVSYADGTATAPENILKASLQLDMFQPEIKDAWKLGIFMRQPDFSWKTLNQQLRSKSQKYIDFLEAGGLPEQNPEMLSIVNEINAACEKLNHEVYAVCNHVAQQNKIPVLVGGEHSSPLGLLRALNEKYKKFGVLHIDAHMDLRSSYEGFKYSHASVFNNAITQGYINKLVQVGIRDFCEEEQNFAEKHGVILFYDDTLKANNFNGITWAEQCHKIIDQLPEDVYVSFDIDGLNPHLCPNTGTPVPGGLEFAEAIYLIKELVQSGRKIIGFDLCEVGGIESEWDGNVGARILYNLCNWTGRSQGLL